jgi:serine/threonine protein kinase
MIKSVGMANPGSPADENEVPTLAPGTILGKYSIVRLLGAGGMGAVYEATHTEIGKKVAIKVLSPLIAAVPGARARFLREAQLTSRVRHPHIVDVADMGSDGGNTYLVMEFLHGEDLAQRLERLGPIGFEELSDIMLPVCSAVAAAHAAGITHRDLKPQNIFLAAGTRRVHPKVLDFGISKGNDAVTQAGTLTGTGAMIGTPYYLAPEQILDNRAAGPGSDQYALGVILYECVTGWLPYEGSNLAAIFQAIVQGTYPQPRAHRPDLPEAYERVITRAMSLFPGDRYPDLRQMGQALLPFASAKTRLVWQDQFAASSAPADARSPDDASPVPVTDQMPGPTRSPVLVTAWIPGSEPPASAAPEPSPLWIPPTRAPASDRFDPALAVPRRFGSARWAVGGGALIALAVLIAAVAGRGRPRTTTAVPATPPSATTAAAPPPPAAAQTVRNETIAAPKQDAPARTERQARATARPRLGSNKAPIIE